MRSTYIGIGVFIAFMWGLATQPLALGCAVLLVLIPIALIITGVLYMISELIAYIALFAAGSAVTALFLLNPNRKQKEEQPKEEEEITNWRIF
jgi:membrane protein implicated in regulation of membrane protease activity